MRYDLSRLGDAEFENLSQALAIRVLGNSIQVFGDGPDGGREAAFEGKLQYPEPSPDGPWEGYGILQAKYKRQLTTSTEDTAWFIRQVRGELQRWRDHTSRRVKQGRIPQYVLFATNVNLSSVPGSGIDMARAAIADYRDSLGLKGWDIWHQDQICRYLDNYSEIRRTYAGFVTPGDVLATLERLLDGSPAKLGPLLSSHAAKEMLAQKYIRLSESGGSGTDRLYLGAVAVDLPARLSTDSPEVQRPKRPAEDEFEELSDQDGGIVAEILRSGDVVHSEQPGREFEPHIVVIGGPGQGKSTIGQLVCQAYRVALLIHRPTSAIGPEANDLLRHLERDLLALRIPTPNCRRWPIQVSLSKYGDAIARGRDVSLLQHLSDVMAPRTTISATELRTWLRAWPWLVVLDGLDEVPVPAVREVMMTRISDFLVDAGEAGADLLIVATTRPQGYGREFSAPFYQHWHLQPLSRGQAVTYASRLADARHGDDPDFRDQVLSRVDTASREPITARLMRTPLQVTILSLLLERRTRVPQDRYGLFEAYYTTLYDRETSKGTSIARLLQANRRHVDYIHERVGLILQARAERAGKAESLLPFPELRQIAFDRLIAEGFDELEAARLAQELVGAATERLVMLAPLRAENVGFEIRSLQELMAARALSSGSDDDVMDRLALLARAAHWRNTWLFVASRVFAQRESLRDRVLNLLTTMDIESAFEMFVATGSRLALDLLDEDVAAQAPTYQRLLVQKAVAVLEFFAGSEIDRMARILRDTAMSDRQSRALVDRAIDRALTGSGHPALAALQLLRAWERRPQNDDDYADSYAEARHRLIRIAGRREYDLTAAIDALEDFGRHRRSSARRPPMHGQQSLLGPPALMQEIQRRRYSETTKSTLKEIAHLVLDQQFEALTPLLDERMKQALVSLIERLPLATWAEAAELRELLIAWHEQRPIPERELDSILRSLVGGQELWNAV